MYYHVITAKIIVCLECSMILLTILQLYRPDDIYHVTVMPCYDKKLEASRSDFYNDIYRTRDVDCVLTSGKDIIFL